MRKRDSNTNYRVAEEPDIIFNYKNFMLEMQNLATIKKKFTENFSINKPLCDYFRSNIYSFRKQTIKIAAL